jgi:hypothetical protein
VTIRLTETKL